MYKLYAWIFLLTDNAYTIMISFILVHANKLANYKITDFSVMHKKKQQNKSFIDK